MVCHLVSKNVSLKCRVFNTLQYLGSFFESRNSLTSPLIRFIGCSMYIVDNTQADIVADVSCCLAQSPVALPLTILNCFTLVIVRMQDHVNSLEFSEPLCPPQAGVVPISVDVSHSPIRGRASPGVFPRPTSILQPCGQSSCNHLRPPAVHASRAGCPSEVME